MFPPAVSASCRIICFHGAPASLFNLTVHAMGTCQKRGRAWMGRVDAETVEAGGLRRCRLVD